MSREAGRREAVDPNVIDVAATFDDHCGPFGPNSEQAYAAEAFTVVPIGQSEQGVRLFYWIEPAGGQEPATCNEVGGGIDAGPERPLSPDFDYIEFLGPRQQPLTASEVGACQAVLDTLCE